MLLITLSTPLMSVTSLVTRLFSAAFLAIPVRVTSLFIVWTPVFVAMEQERGFHLRGDPGVGMFGGAFTFDGQLIVHAFDAGQAFHRIFSQRFVGGCGDGSGQSHDSVLGLSLDRIILQVGFEYVGI